MNTLEMLEGVDPYCQKWQSNQGEETMFKRIMIALVGLFAVLGLAVGTAGAAPSTSSDAPTASNEGAGALAETATLSATFHGWTLPSYEDADSVDGLRPTTTQPVVVQDFARIESAALIDKTVEVQLFSGVKDPTTGTCQGTPVATLNATNMADGGWVATSTAGSQQSRLQSVGAQCAIITI